MAYLLLPAPPARKGMWPPPHLLPLMSLAHSLLPPLEKAGSLLLMMPLQRQHRPPTNQQGYPKTPSFPNEPGSVSEDPILPQPISRSAGVWQDLSSHSFVFGYKNRHDHAPRVGSPWLSASRPTVRTVSLASINLSFLHLGLNLENCFSTHMPGPQLPTTGL